MAVIAGVAVLALAGVTAYFVWPHPPASQTQTAQPAHGPQVTLPFTGLNLPSGVAVDAAGNVYVADSFNNRVVKLAAGSATQEVLPFTGLYQPVGVAVDAAGNLYVGDKSNNRVLKLAAGSATQEVLPFTGLYFPYGVAVDPPGNLYVADYGNGRVVELAPGSGTQTVLPFAGLDSPIYVAVDAAGNVYVGDGTYPNRRVLKLAAGSTTQTVLPFTGMIPGAVAVDSADNICVGEAKRHRPHEQPVDYARVLKLAAGSSTPTVLPFTGLDDPQGVAVDAAGNVYVTDMNNRVVKLPVG